MPGRYTRERTRIGATTIERVTRMMRTGTVPGAGIDIADEGTPGLILRVNKRFAVWFLKTKRRTVRLSDMANLGPREARIAAANARAALEKGKDPAESLEVYALAKAFDDVDAEEAAWRPPPVDRDARRRQNGPWNLQDLIEEFVAWKRPRLRESYADKWERYLRRHAIARFAGMLVRDLRIETLEEIRDGLVAAHPTSSAWRSVQQLKEGLSWAWRHQARRSGLGATEYEWWERLTLEYAPGVREHTPTIEELARTLAVVEALGLARGRAAAAGTLPALWAVVLTGQRTGPLVSTRLDYVLDDAEREGWKIVAWPRPAMKSKRAQPIPHALPIPPAAWSRISAAAGGGFLFPSRGGRPLTKSALNLLFLRLDGTRGRAGDLFAAHGIRRWTPHDARRTLSTFLGDRRLGGAASAILDHRDTKVPEPERTADVTRLVYDRAQRLELKAEGMAAWAQAVIAAYERERAKVA